MRDSIAWAKAHNDYLVHTGDMVDMVSKANLDLVKKYFGEGGEMMLGCLGNHEYYYGRAKARNRRIPTCSAARSPIRS